MVEGEEAVWASRPLADYVIDNCGQDGDAAFEVLPGVGSV